MEAATVQPFIEKRQIRPRTERNDKLALRLFETKKGSDFVLRKDADGTPKDKIVFHEFPGARKITWMQAMQTLIENGMAKKVGDGRFTILQCLSELRSSDPKEVLGPESALLVLNSIVLQGSHAPKGLHDSDVHTVENVGS